RIPTGATWKTLLTFNDSNRTSILDHIYVDSSIEDIVSVIVLNEAMTDHQPPLGNLYGIGVNRL
ncbi:Hypothetical protein FKW44_016725, partial [Caligus rogercresseyi]